MSRQVSRLCYVHAFSCDLFTNMQWLNILQIFDVMVLLVETIIVFILSMKPSCMWAISLVQPIILRPPEKSPGRLSQTSGLFELFTELVILCD